MAVIGIPGLLVLWALVSLSSPQQQQQQRVRGGQEGLSPNIVTDEVRGILIQSNVQVKWLEIKRFVLCCVQSTVHLMHNCFR